MNVGDATQELVKAVRGALWGRTADDLIADPGMQGVANALEVWDKAKAEEKRELAALSKRLSFNLGRSYTPRWVYWEHKGIRYCYNTTPANEDGGRWFAWEYRINPTPGDPKTLVMAHRVRCATRTKAKAKAYSWYQQARGQHKQAGSS